MTMPGDFAIQVFRRAFWTLERLGLGPEHAKGVRGRWRLHPDAVTELARRARTSELVWENPQAEKPEYQVTLIGLPIIQDSTLDVADLRFEVEA